MEGRKRYPPEVIKRKERAEDSKESTTIRGGDQERRYLLDSEKSRGVWGD